MLITDAQREMRTAYMGGFIGQLVAGIIWALSAAVSLWISPRIGMIILFFVSMLLFPLTQFILRRMGQQTKLGVGNTLGQLAAQIAFTVPIGFILVGVATLYEPNWFYPASLIVVGAHYWPFVFLYGMKHFAILGNLMIIGGTLIALYVPTIFSLGGWYGAIILIAFAFVGRMAILREVKPE